MESVLIFLGLAIVGAAVYKLSLQKLGGPQAIVRGLLRQYHSFAAAGLPERESLMRVLLGRRGWRDLPPAFLAEIVARLQSKENVFRFVSLAEGYKFDRRELPAIAADSDSAAAMRRIAAWLVDFGMRLENEGRLKEAEFVQKLALALEPHEGFTKLPLAATYYKMRRYADALPLFTEGLAALDNSTGGCGSRAPAPLRRVHELKARYEEMRASCLGAAAERHASGSEPSSPSRA